MFKIIEYRNHSGKIKWQPTFAGFSAQSVSFWIFNSGTKRQEFQPVPKTAPHKLALLKKEFAEQLKRFWSMHGTRIQRMRILKEIRVPTENRYHWIGLRPKYVVLYVMKKKIGWR